MASRSVSREELFRTFNDSETVIEESVGEYKTFGDILWPTLFVSGTKDAPENERLQIETIEPNAVVDDREFAFPGKAKP